MTVRDALNSALDDEMELDDKVFIMGEELTKSLEVCSKNTVPNELKTRQLQRLALLG
jgi:pyruvate/2-oxoglutarate/acetoin dehydrogenase E1 component